MFFVLASNFERIGGESKPAYGPKIREIHERKEISNMKLLASGSNQENRLQIKQRYK